MTDFAGVARNALVTWRNIRVAELGYWHLDSARLAIVVFVAMTVVALTVRAIIKRKNSSARVALPALLASFGRQPVAFLRHAPVLLSLLAVPFLILALADPHSALIKQTVSHPGRRIGLMVDASASMSALFAADDPKSGTTFQTTVSAAERFIRLRMEGKYRDLIALVEFGSRAYVITPFTSDYDNILLSTSLIADPDEFRRFPEKTTSIGLAIEQSTELFRAFDFLDVSGNLMVIFSDGEDYRVVQGDKTVSEIVGEAVKAKIPIYFIRTKADKQFGEIIPDKMWKEAVEVTGGRFFAAANEASIAQAIREIDRLSEGTIELQQFAAQRPQFAPFALIAVLLLSIASLMKLTLPYFRRFP